MLRHPRRTATLLALVVLASTLPASADTTVRDVSGAAQASSVAVRVARPSVDLVAVSHQQQLTSATIALAEDAAREVGARTALTRGVSIGMTAVRRGGTVVQQASGPSGLWQFPMSTTVVPVGAAGEVMSGAVAAALAAGQVVMGATSAGLRGAQAGDVIDLVAANGSILSFVIGYVAPDHEVGSTEIVMTPEQADSLGATRVTRILLFGQFSRDAIDAALAARGLIDGTSVRVSRSWSPRNPDGTLGAATTKKLLGEFDYEVTSTGLRLDADWAAANIVRVNYADIGVRANCHRAIVADLQAALTEVAAAGLAWAIDLSNTNTYGGCFNPRFNRLTGSIGFVSRHAWGQPIDMNTVTNAQGRAPQMDCRVVRIFRKHNFAWGGNFLIPDGMHFEWVGEPRHELQYPSEYCPNLPGGSIQVAGVEETERAVMFANDGWSDEHP